MLLQVVIVVYGNSRPAATRLRCQFHTDPCGDPWADPWFSLEQRDKVRSPSSSPSCPSWSSDGWDSFRTPIIVTAFVTTALPTTQPFSRELSALCSVYTAVRLRPQVPRFFFTFARKFALLTLPTRISLGRYRSIISRSSLSSSSWNVSVPPPQSPDGHPRVGPTDHGYFWPFG